MEAMEAIGTTAHLVCLGRVEEIRKPHLTVRLSKSTSGSDLLSQAVPSLVPSALEGLTSVFGMGTGVAPPL
jgi:hypothetical protein